MKKYFLALLITLSALSLFAQAPKTAGKGAPQAPQMPPAIVAVSKSVAIAQRPSKQYIGIVEAIDTVELPVRVNAFITKEHFKEGSEVKKGDLLYELEDVSYVAQANAAESARDQIIPELKFALQNYNRQKGLKEKDVASEASVEEAERLLMLTKARLAAAEATLLDAQNTVTYTKIYAPLTGRIGRAEYSVGQYVTPASKPLVSIVQTNPIYIKFSISEREYLNLYGSLDAKDGKANAKIKRANGTFLDAKGTLALVDNKANTASGTITMWFQYPNDDHSLIPGGYVTVSLSDSSEKPLVGVKVTAVMTDKSGSYVYVVNDKNIVEKRNIALADVLDGMQTVYSGLELGESVIVDGSHKTHPGQTVMPIQQ